MRRLLDKFLMGFRGSSFSLKKRAKVLPDWKTSFYEGNAFVLHNNRCYVKNDLIVTSSKISVRLDGQKFELKEVPLAARKYAYVLMNGSVFCLSEGYCDTCHFERGVCGLICECVFDGLRPVYVESINLKVL